MPENDTPNPDGAHTAVATSDSGIRPRPPSAVYAQDAELRVSSIWDGWNWYSLAFRLLSKFQVSRLWRRSPHIVKNGTIYGLNFLLAFHQHDLNKVWSGSDPFKNLQLPEDEHVRVPGIWVVEIFPPSQSANLRSRLERNGWDKTRRLAGLGEGNRAKLDSSRSGLGWKWWVLAHIVDHRRRQLNPLAYGQKLPDEFQEIEVTAVQIGDGLTAVIAHFQLSTHASTIIDKAWHHMKRPRIRWEGGLPRALDRKSVAIRDTQAVRDDLHVSARSWLNETCPGFFAAKGQQQPLLDLMLLDQHNPLLTGPSYEVADALRAIGLPSQDPFRRSSSDLPGLLLTPSISPFEKADVNRTWTLWGKRQAVWDGLPSGGVHLSDQAIAAHVHGHIRNTLVRLTLAEFLNGLEREYAGLRDQAHTQRRRVRRRDLERLRSSFLISSLDISSVVRDIKTFYARPKKRTMAAGFRLAYAVAPEPTHATDSQQSTGKLELNMDERLRREQRAQCDRLASADKEYREILSTVASLGSSIDAFKVGRLAIVIAVASLGVALVTLLVTDLGTSSILSAVATHVRSTDWTTKLTNLLAEICSGPAAGS